MFSRLILCFVVFLRLHCLWAHFDLFLSTQEVKSLLGLPRELAFVRNGLVNQNALLFKIPISENEDTININWFNRNPKLKLSYSLRINLDNYQAMHQPSHNISAVGILPSKPSVWRVTLPCSGRISSKVLITLSLKFMASSPGNLSADITTVDVLCTKMCTSILPKKIRQQKSTFGLKPHVVFLCTTVALGFVITLIIGFASFKNWRRSSNLDGTKVVTPNCLVPQHFCYEQVRQASSPLLPTDPPGPFLTMDPSSSHPITYRPLENISQSDIDAGLQWPAATSDALRSAADWLNFLRVDAESVSLVEPPILTGTFGRIYTGIFTSTDGSSQDVMVKTIRPFECPMTTQIRAMEICGTSLCHHSGAQSYHRNLLIPIAAVPFELSPTLLIYPMVPVYGNLKVWLGSGGGGMSTTHQVVSLSLQLLAAMQQIHKRKIVHKDIATRNCFVGDGFLLKLCDGALSRDLFPTDYNCLGDNENRPIRWMPREAILDSKQFSKASDVWAFGVFVWELMTRCQVPYGDVDPFEMARYLHDGYRLHQPLNCPDQLFYILSSSCWQAMPNDRENVHSIYRQLQAFQKQLKQFV